MTAWASIVVGFLTVGLLTGLIERVRQPGARQGPGSRGRWAAGHVPPRLEPGRSMLAVAPRPE